MTTLIAIILLWIGGAFVLLAAVGLAKFPDVFMRMHATTKAGTLGIAGLAIAIALHANRLDVTFQAVLIIVFFLLTAPVATHMIGRAAYLTGVPLWRKTVCDEFGQTGLPPQSENQPPRRESADPPGP